MGIVRGGNIYWGRKEADSKGIVVIFAWVSIQDSCLKNYVDIYSSLGWNSLVCYAHFLTAFHSERAIILASIVLNELVEELRAGSCPVVFLAVSAGSKACMYKVVQAIEGTCKSQNYSGNYRLLRNCISGHIYDSGPLDVTSDLGMQFVLPPTIRKMSGPSKFVSWAAKCVTSGLDALYLTRFESLDSEYWQALYSSVNWEVPFLILVSGEDDIAQIETISSFAQKLHNLGGDVELVKLDGSPHGGHYKHHPGQYRTAVRNFLEKAASVYYQKIHLLGRETVGIKGMPDEISELICDLQKVTVHSNQSFRRVAVGPSDHVFLPSSAEHQSGEDSGSVRDDQRQKSVYLARPPSINAHSVLGQILFDVCVPKNIEGWDVKFSGCLNGRPRPFASASSHSPINGIKSTGRSKL